jgi:hypothetical protein
MNLPTRSRRACGHSLTFERAPADAVKVFDYPEQNSGDHFQNVQLLKELPSSALTPLMGTYQAALGVDCAFCHNQSAYESDEKTGKKDGERDDLDDGRSESAAVCGADRHYLFHLPSRPNDARYAISKITN